MSKFLAAGQSLANIIKWSTENPASQIQLPDLGHLTVGAAGDIAVLRVEKGKFGFVDQNSTAIRVDGTERLSCEITLRNGQVVYDLNGITKTAYVPK
jgi:dihydroorotase